MAAAVPFNGEAHWPEPVTPITKTFTPMYDRLLVRRSPEKETIGSGILQAADQYKEKQTDGVVLAIGEGRLMVNGTIVPLRVKVGDTVAFNLFAGLPLPEDFGKDLIVLSEDEIVGKVSHVTVRPADGWAERGEAGPLNEGYYGK